MKEIEGFEALRLRYLNGNRRAKGEVLNGLCTLHGYNRKSAIRLLNAEVNRLCEGKPKQKRKRGRKARYLGDVAFEAVLRGLWSETDYMCSTNLVKARAEWLPAYEEISGAIRADVRDKVLTVSSATIVKEREKWSLRIHVSRGSQKRPRVFLFAAQAIADAHGEKSGLKNPGGQP